MYSTKVESPMPKEQTRRDKERRAKEVAEKWFRTSYTCSGSHICEEYRSSFLVSATSLLLAATTTN